MMDYFLEKRLGFWSFGGSDETLLSKSSFLNVTRRASRAATFRPAVRPPRTNQRAAPFNKALAVADRPRGGKANKLSSWQVQLRHRPIRGTKRCSSDLGLASVPWIRCRNMIKRRGPYKQYLRDPSIPIPRTTLRRRLREHARLFQSPEQDRHGTAIKEEYKLECNPVLLSQLECEPVQNQHEAKVELKREHEALEDGWACSSTTAQRNVMDKRPLMQCAPAASTIDAVPQVSTLSLKKNRVSDTWARKNGKQNSGYRVKYTSSRRVQDLEPEPPEGHSWMANGDHQYSEPQERLYEAFTPTSRYSRPRALTSTTLHSTPHHHSRSQIALSEREAYFQAEAAKWRTKYETHKGDFSQLHKIVERLTFLVERLEHSVYSCHHRSGHTDPCSHTSRELAPASWSVQDDRHSDDEFEEKVHIGNNIFLAKHQYEKLRQFDAKQFTANLLALLFSREEMATHVLLDDKSHVSRREARPKLNKDIVQAIVCHIVDKFKLDPKTVMEFVRTKLETEERMYKLSAIQSCFS